MGIRYEEYNDPESEYALDPDGEYVMFFRDRSSGAMELNERREPSNRDLRITDVQTTMVGGNYKWTFIQIYTDAGLVGIGESYPGAGVPEAIASMKPYIIGENPLDIDRLVQHLMLRMSGEGATEGGTVVTAISGIDIALHDLVGKVYDMPAYQLLGGKYRDRVRVYCDSHAGEHAESAEDLDPTDLYTPEAYAEAARVVADDGFDAIKFDLDVKSGYERDRVNGHLRGQELAHKRELIEAAVTAVDDDVDVAFDCHGVWTGKSALRLARAIEDLDVLWLEDPVPPGNTAILRDITENTTTTITAGERYYLTAGIRDLIEERAVDVIHPDLPKFGGMREVRKTADIAAEYTLPVAFHNVSSPIATLAAAHVATAIPNFMAIEYHARDVPWWHDLVYEPVIEDGYITVPERPGLGISLDYDVIEEHMVAGETLFDEP